MPEFPLSKPDIEGSEPAPRERKRDSNSSRRWRLYSISYYANLQPSQIVREMDAADRGWDPDYDKGHEHAPRAVRQDGTADADRQRENTPDEGQIGPITIDERRYVVDPIVEGHKYEGLWTGGPILHAVVQGHKVLRQTLTRTWCAGHGYTVAKDGSYIAEWPASFDQTTGTPTSWTETTPEGYGGVHGTSGNKDKEHSDAPTVREYRTASDCLKACRPWMEGRLSPYMVFRTDIPSSYTREVYWREFTHESIMPLEKLGKDVEKLREVIAYHFGAEVAGNVLDAHTRVDPATNTVVFVCSLLYTELAEPKTADELLELPVIDAPCTRDTLRMFGWNQMRNGEGYEYTHVFRWPRLKDTPTTRATIEFIRDNASLQDSFLLDLLEHHRTNSKSPGWWSGYEDRANISLAIQLDNTGRLETTANAQTAKQVQHYRIAQQKVDEEQDGSIAFTIAISKAEWHGYDSGTNYEDGGTRQLSSISNAQGYGITEHRVVPSLPRENAIPTMNAITAGPYEVISNKSQTEGQKGSSDVSFDKRKTYDYLSAPGTGHTPGDIVDIDGSVFHAPVYAYDPETNVYHLTYPQVNKDKVQQLIDSLRQKLGGDPKIKVSNDGGGVYTVTVTGKGLNPRHVPEWIVSADWFQHETVEQWIGVAFEKDSNGNPTGFYSKYEKNASGQLVHVPGSLVRIEAVRGDLDANWMGSEPQECYGSTSPILYFTIGTNDAKRQKTGIDHNDQHGDGWSASAWTDPDAVSDTQDKRRSHAITRVHHRINGDDTMDISITRIYPHPLVWEWETEKSNGKRNGEWKTVYHIEYRNWPSRKSIKKDLVERWASLKGVDLESDDWVYHFTPNVNHFGLVDAANVTIEPLFYNDGKGRSKTTDPKIDDASEYKFYRYGGRPMTAKVSPGSAAHTPAFAPLLGYYFGVEKKTILIGHGYATEAAALTEWSKLVNTGIINGNESKAPYAVGTGNNQTFSFKYVTGWVLSPVAYNGVPPVPAQSGNHHGQVVNANGKKAADLSRETWELWFKG